MFRTNICKKDFISVDNFDFENICTLNPFQFHRGKSIYWVFSFILKLIGLFIFSIHNILQQ